MTGGATMSSLVLTILCLVPAARAFFTLSTSPITGGQFTVSYTADESTKGYQFNIFSAPGVSITIDASGTITDFIPGFTTSGGGNTVLGFSLSGASIPASNGQVLPLVSLPVASGPNGVAPCLADVVVSADPAGAVETVDFPSCTASSAPSPPPPPSTPPASGGTPVFVQASSVSSGGAFDVQYTSNVLVSGFQFDVLNAASETGVAIASVATTLTGFSVSGGNTGTIVGFSLSGDVVPITSTFSTLVTANVASAADFGIDLCLEQLVFSDPGASAVDVGHAPCASAPSPPPPPPSQVILDISEVKSDSSFDILYTSNIPFSGYQFDVGAGLEDVVVSSVTSSPQLTDFTPSAGGSTIIGFSLSGAFVPSAQVATLLCSAVLTDSSLVGSTNLCLKNVVISGSGSGSGVPAVPAVFPPCPETSAPSPPPPPPSSTPGSGQVSFTATTITGSGTFQVLYKSDVAFAGFQFDVLALETAEKINLSPDVTSSTALTVSAGPVNTVIGFSLAGETVPPSGFQDQPLASLSVVDVSKFAASHVCMENVVASNPAAQALSATGPECAVVGGSSVSLSISGNGAVKDIFYSSPIEIAAFQFEMWQQSPVAAVLLSDAASPIDGMSVSIQDNVVVAFSLSATTYPVGDGLLMSATLTGAVTPTANNMCLNAPVFSSSTASAIPADGAVCQDLNPPDLPSSPPPPPATPQPQVNVELFATQITAEGTFKVLVTNTVLLSLVQFNVQLDNGALPVAVVSSPFAVSFTVANGVSSTVTAVSSGNNFIAPVGSSGTTSQELVTLQIVAFDVSMAFKTPCLTLPVASSTEPVSVSALGACPPKVQPVSVSLSIIGNEFSVSTAALVPISGFQMTFSSGKNPVQIKDNVKSDLEGFTIDVSGDTIVGFSLSGDVIPAVPETLFTAQLEDPTNLDGLCLAGPPILSDTDAQGIPVTAPICEDVVATVTTTPLSVTTVSEGGTDALLGEMAFLVQNDIDLKGFQLNFVDLGGAPVAFTGVNKLLDDPNDDFSIELSSDGTIVLGYTISAFTIGASSIATLVAKLELVADNVFLFDNAQVCVDKSPSVLSDPAGLSAAFAIVCQGGTTPEEPSPGDDDSGDDDSSNTAAIVGGVIGGIVGLLLLLALLIFCCRRRQSSPKAKQEMKLKHVEMLPEGGATNGAPLSVRVAGAAAEGGEAPAAV